MHNLGLFLLDRGHGDDISMPKQLENTRLNFKFDISIFIFFLDNAFECMLRICSASDNDVWHKRHRSPFKRFMDGDYPIGCNSHNLRQVIITLFCEL